ncbi:hypothetical protein HPB48_006229 [Haemaphysalis longicornis]|uniref:thioredoxin-dependent peroxiredoxin n=1 Tax=Haemaphysalis longicornis TaxID=44386 RepID=A0A9J6FU22_HAELO|nr:hypothetical protein HPB48_006229 [Haemaphysalis longicornis]
MLISSRAGLLFGLTGVPPAISYSDRAKQPLRQAAAAAAADGGDGVEAMPTVCEQPKQRSLLTMVPQSDLITEDVVMPKLAKPAPDFRGTAVVDGQFKEIKLSDYKNKYLVLFFYPLDFTFVCPTEIIAFSDRVEEFRKINCEVVACSTDSHFSHLACGLFIIDDKGRLRQITMNDLPVGRSVDETLRLVQAFQYTDKHGEVCPANWKPGSDTMKPDPKGSKAYFAKQ